MSARPIATEGRVTIRRFRRSDLADRVLWPPYTEPFFVHLNYDLSSFIERERWIFARLMNSGRMYFAILDENEKLIGEMSLRDIDPDSKGSRLGIHLASDRLGRAYGREALTALLRHYFTDMKWAVMYLDVAAYNARAIRLYERLGFVHISPFWRRIAVDERVMTNPQYASIWHFLRRGPGGVECLHYDMALAREKYIESFAGKATERPIPEKG